MVTISSTPTNSAVRVAEMVTAYQERLEKEIKHFGLYLDRFHKTVEHYYNNPNSTPLEQPLPDLDGLDVDYYPTKYFIVDTRCRFYSDSNLSHRKGYDFSTRPPIISWVGLDRVNEANIGLTHSIHYLFLLRYTETLGLSVTQELYSCFLNCLTTCEITTTNWLTAPNAPSIAVRNNGSDYAIGVASNGTIYNLDGTISYSGGWKAVS